MKNLFLLCAVVLASTLSFDSFADSAPAPAPSDEGKKFDAKACKKRCMEELNESEKCEFICNRDKK